MFAQHVWWREGWKQKERNQGLLLDEGHVFSFFISVQVDRKTVSAQVPETEESKKQMHLIYL